MKRTRKEELLGLFPSVPNEFKEKMQGQGAANFVIFLTRGDELFARCYHRYSSGALIERQRYVFAKDGCVRYGLDSNDKWRIRTEFREPVFCAACYGYSFDNTYYVLNERAIEKSCMRYSMVDEFGNSLMIEYLGLYCKHPNVEYLIKAGYSSLITEDYVGCYWGSRKKLIPPDNIDWKSNNLLKMLHLNRTEFAALRGSETYYDYYIFWRKQHPKYKPSELLDLAKVFGYERGTVERCCGKTGLTPHRLARYIRENDIAKYDYRDYIEQCEQLDYNLHDTAICMPHDFQTMHSRLSQLIKYKQSEEAKQQFREHISEREVLEYESGGLIIRQPHHIEEIEDEGRLLKHCVGGYAKRHALGKLHILFIRRNDDPDTPYYTMELSTEGRIVQVKGIKNCKPTPEVSRLVEQYKQYLKTIFKKARKTA